jgi:hypothetical protein
MSRTLSPRFIPPDEGQANAGSREKAAETTPCTTKASAGAAAGALTKANTIERTESSSNPNSHLSILEALPKLAVPRSQRGREHCRSISIFD